MSKKLCDEYRKESYGTTLSQLTKSSVSWSIIYFEMDHTLII